MPCASEKRRSRIDWYASLTSRHLRVCVSMVLQAGDADFHWLKHPADLGLASERQQEVDDGQWAIPDSFFEPT